MTSASSETSVSVVGRESLKLLIGRSRAFFDIKIGNNEVGRLAFELVKNVLSVMYSIH